MKSNIKKLALVVIEAMMLFFGVACQKEIEPDEVPIDNYKSVVVGSIRLDTTRKCVSKKWHYAEESSVYVYNKDGKTGKTYKTIRLMSEDLRIIQEWMVEYLHNNVVSDCHICSLDPDGDKYGYFYKWRGNLYHKTDTDFKVAKSDCSMRYYHLPAGMIVSGFRIPSTQDLADLYSMYTKDYDFLNYRTSNKIVLEKGMWVNAGLYANENTERYGMYALIPTKYGDVDIQLVTTNNPDVYCRVRLMRTLTLDQWEEDD